MKSFYITLGIFIMLTFLFFFSKKKDNDSSMPEKISYNRDIRPILSDRCFKCHGPDANKREANLRLDIPESAFAALKSNPSTFALTPYDPEKSEVFLRIHTEDASLRMPPLSSNLTLTQEEIALVKKWIEQGAVYETHWAFLPPSKSEIPTTPKLKKWAINEIDHFIGQKCIENGLKPNMPASKEQLLKRLCLDLTGLPPSIELQQQFEQDKSDKAYENLIDTLLVSPHFGEKMAVLWLDIARYADSHGYQDDGYRSMWPWRDWVIHAFNQNYSYKQFVSWQLAGDLLPKKTREMVLATGFNRNHKITQEGGVIDEEYRVEYVSDRTNTFGKAFLALTVECAKCHDHKYDPISQKDYYSLSAFFNQVDEKGFVGDITVASEADPPKMTIAKSEIDSMLTFIHKLDTMPVEVMVMGDVKEKRPTYLLERGLYDQHGALLEAATPKAVLPFDTSVFEVNRAGLAAWLFSKKNPLTARVAVNIFWQEIFGEGLVRSSGDFGQQGSAPSHPRLLDWLAVDFVENGWDVKRLLKQMLLSATYRQSAERSATQVEIDPKNLYLSYFPRKRLKAEFVRDLILASSGLLVEEIGGHSVKPHQPKGIWEASSSGRGQLAHYVQDEGKNLYRRGLYTLIKRTAPPPNLLLFDGSTRDQCEVKRPATQTPLQALALLNDPVVLEAARFLAERIQAKSLSKKEKIESIFQRILCRKADSKEKKWLLEYYQEEETAFLTKPENAKILLNNGSFPKNTSLNPSETAALMQVILLLYNLEETMVRS